MIHIGNNLANACVIVRRSTKSILRNKVGEVAHWELAEKIAHLIAERYTHQIRYDDYNDSDIHELSVYVFSAEEIQKLVQDIRMDVEVTHLTCAIK